MGIYLETRRRAIGLSHQQHLHPGQEVVLASIYTGSPYSILSSRGEIQTKGHSLGGRTFSRSGPSSVSVFLAIVGDAPLIINHSEQSLQSDYHCSKIYKPNFLSLECSDSGFPLSFFPSQNRINLLFQISTDYCHKII